VPARPASSVIFIEGESLGCGLRKYSYPNSVRTSQETHYVSATKPNQLMLFKETVAVYFENHTEHTDTLYFQNTEFCCVRSGGIYRNHWALLILCEGGVKYLHRSLRVVVGGEREPSAGCITRPLCSW
jgi:hypothetical protein